MGSRETRHHGRDLDPMLLESPVLEHLAPTESGDEHATIESSARPEAVESRRRKLAGSAK